LPGATCRPAPRAADRSCRCARPRCQAPGRRPADRAGNERIRRTAGSRDDALPAALIAAHLIITVSDGAFLSMTDPPEWASHEVGGCQNTGCWPVLAGPEYSREIMLAAPIILPDHPQVAPESPVDLYDGTEIDEILTLRTLALSDEEKAAARATDPRAAALIDRVETMDAATMAQLHGTIRAMSAHTAASEPASPAGRRRARSVGGITRCADASVSPGTDSVSSPAPPRRPRQPGDPAAGGAPR